MAEEQTGRRKTLELLIAAGSCALGAVMVGPAVVFVAGPAQASGDTKARWVKVAKVSALKDGKPTKMPVIADDRDAWSVAKDVELGAIWVTKNAEKIQVLSCVCPHLGCAVNIDEHGFICPCHTSRFDFTGHKESGPTPRDMDPLETKIDGDDLYVDFKRFRVGTEDREVSG